MSYASQSMRARTSPSSPQAFGICDRCSLTYNLCDLKWQMDWRGPSLRNLNLLVCDICLDDPQEQLRTVALPADPVPVKNVRIDPYLTPIPD